ncbi:tRNA/rRNA methyltransferase [Oceanicella actignis]|nr:RNA methyltransferase [Oceanicella actignis]TYO85230.1 tRNA/rRNA methyltransferase [Oceanicella actignis]
MSAPRNAAAQDRKSAVWSPDGPIFVLVEPQMGENIGAAARAMWNFGLARMRLVAPRDGWPNPKAAAMASGAGRVIDEAQVFAQTAPALADLNYVYATTARAREMTKPVMTPEEAMADAHARVARGERVGVMFGRERTGLENDDVARANAIVTAPVNPAFPSLNLGQCALLVAYEWRRQAPADENAAPRPEPAAARVEDVDRMLAHLEQELEAAGYFFPEDRRASMQMNLRNLFRRAPLTDQDVRTLRGVIRSLAEGRRRR